MAVSEIGPRREVDEEESTGTIIINSAREEDKAEVVN